MRDWKAMVRKQLADTGLEPEHEADVVEEIAAQLEDCYSAGLRAGMTEEEAVKDALVQVTDWQQLATEIGQARTTRQTGAAEQWMARSEERSRTRGGSWITVADFLQELRITWRRLARSGGFTTVVLTTLALAIGGTTAVFSLVQNILLEPLPFEEADRLVSIWNSAPGMTDDLMPQSPALHFTYEDENQSFEDIGIWWEAEVRVLGTEGVDLMQSMVATHGVMNALRAAPQIGRLFSEEDNRLESSATVVLSYRFWQDRLGGTSDVLSRSVNVNGSERQVIGVLPEAFRFTLGDEPLLYLPFRLDKSELFLGNFSYRSIGRLKAGVDIETATADLARLITVASERFPGGVPVETLEAAGAAPLLRPAVIDVVGDVGNVLWIVFGTAAITLLIAAANLANLFLVRADARRLEVALHTAMGAGRGRLTRQALLESLSLSVAGGALGLVVAYGGLRLLTRIASQRLPRLDQVNIDLRVLGFAFGLSLLVGIVFGLLPSLGARADALQETLKSGGARGGTSVGRQRGRHALVVGQLSLALVLLVGSGLMIRTFSALQDVDPGFSNADQVLTVTISVPATEVPDEADVPAVHERLSRRMSELPGVEQVGMTTSVSMDGRHGFDPLFVEDFPLGTGETPQARRFKWIGPGYFETMQNELVAGRPLSWPDIENRSRAVWVTENFARSYWQDPAAAIGRRVGVGLEPGQWWEIAGVVGDVRDDGLGLDAPEIVYWPFVLEGFWTDVSGDPLMVIRTLTYAIRGPRVGTPDFLSSVREVVRAELPLVPLASVQTLDDLLTASMARTSFTTTMLGLAAALALLLATLGVYGVLSYITNQRTREFGVRIAMGAEPGNLTGMMLGRGLRMGLWGIGLGCAVALGLTRLMSSLLHGVSATDPTTFVVVSATLLGVALLASYLPALRASRIDPATSLRSE